MSQDSDQVETEAIRKAHLILAVFALSIGVIGAIVFWSKSNSSDATIWLGAGFLLAAILWLYRSARLGQMKMWVFLILSQVLLAIYILTIFVAAD